MVPGGDAPGSRLAAWAAQSGSAVVRAEAEAGSGMNGARPKARRLLADAGVQTVAVEHRDRLGRMNPGLAEATLSAPGRRLIILDPGEVDDDHAVTRALRGIAGPFADVAPAGAEGGYAYRIATSEERASVQRAAALARAFLDAAGEPGS